MAEKKVTTSIVGEVDHKPLTKDQKSKVEHALKSAVQAEIIPFGGGIIGSHHLSITHWSVVWEE
jgi:hypothetical protein